MSEKKCVKRKRYRPNRKWSDEETSQLVEYLKKHEFEKPTSKIYYNKFIDECNIDIDWALAKSKVRYMKTMYYKATDWKNSTEANSLSEGRSAADLAKRVCPYYDSLHEVFSKLRRPTPGLDISELGPLCENLMSPPSSPHFKSSQNEPVNFIEVTTSQQSSFDYQQSDEDDADYDDTNSNSLLMPIGGEGQSIEFKFAPVNKMEAVTILPSESQSCINDIMPSVNAEQITGVRRRTNNRRTNNSKRSQPMPKGAYTRSALQDLLSCHTERSEIQKSKLDLEERKFAFEKEKTKLELELRGREIERDERLKILEIESKERIAMKELEIKYSNKD